MRFGDVLLVLIGGVLGVALFVSACWLVDWFVGMLLAIMARG